MRELESLGTDEKSPATIELNRSVWWRRVRSMRYPLALAFLSAVITYFFGYCAYLVFQDKFPTDGWLGIWSRWDALH